MPNDMTPDALVIFTPSGKRGRFALGTPVLTAARQLGVDLDSVCGGRGICSKCQITPGYGEFAKHGLTVEDGALSEWNEVEARAVLIIHGLDLPGLELDRLDYEVGDLVEVGGVVALLGDRPAVVFLGKRERLLGPSGKNGAFRDAPLRSVSPRRLQMPCRRG